MEIRRGTDRHIDTDGRDPSPVYISRCLLLTLNVIEAFCDSNSAVGLEDGEAMVGDVDRLAKNEI